MTTPNASRSIDGTTATSTLNGDHAQVVALEIHYLLGADLEFAPQPWNDLEPLTVDTLEQHAAQMLALYEPYLPAMRQLEAPDVVDFNTAMRLAHDLVTDEYHPSRRSTTGDVTLTCTVEQLDRLAAHMETVNEAHDFPEALQHTAAAMREQLEDAA